MENTNIMPTTTEEPLSAEQKKLIRYKERCLYNWKKTFNVDFSVEEHEEFKKNKKFYLKLNELDPKLIIKILENKDNLKYPKKGNYEKCGKQKNIKENEIFDNNFQQNPEY